MHSVIFRYNSTGGPDLTGSGTPIEIPISMNGDYISDAQLDTDQSFVFGIASDIGVDLFKLFANGLGDTTFGPLSLPSSFGAAYRFIRAPSSPFVNFAASLNGTASIVTISTQAPFSRGSQPIAFPPPIKRVLLASSQSQIVLVTQSKSDSSLDTFALAKFDAESGQPVAPLVVASTLDGPSIISSILALADGSSVIILERSSEIFIHRRFSNGSLDFGFVETRVFSSSSKATATLLSSGSILLCASADNGGGIFLTRLLASGGADLSWNNGRGAVRAHRDLGSLEPSQILADPFTQDIFVVCSANITNSAILKFNSSGASSLDFGLLGRTLGSSIGGLMMENVVIVPNDDRYLYVGGSTAGPLQVPRSAVLRLMRATGLVDTSWASNGTFQHSLQAEWSGSIKKLLWDGTTNTVVAVGTSAQEKSVARASLFRLDVITASLDCFGGSGGILRRDIASVGVADALLSDGSYFVAILDHIQVRLLKYQAQGVRLCDSGYQ
jgi:hypothetical protein